MTSIVDDTLELAEMGAIDRRETVHLEHVLSDHDLQKIVAGGGDAQLQRDNTLVQAYLKEQRLEAVRILMRGDTTLREQTKPVQQEPVYDSLACCPEIYDDGELCGGCFGHQKCCGHKVGKCEPKWVLKLLMVFTELAWAISLQRDLDEFKNPRFIEMYIRPMAWCAWNAMTLHIIMQFMNKMCFGNDALLNQMTLYIDLFADDLVQLVGLSLFWSKEGFGTGDAPAAILTGCLAIVFALHNVFALCAGSGGAGKKLCWGVGHTLEGYKAIDNLDIAWCPHCTCPGLAKCCAACCCEGCTTCCCCPLGLESRVKCCCFKSCYVPQFKDKKAINECNIVCYQCDVFSNGTQAASCGQIFCHIMSNTWLMALWAVHVGAIAVFLIKYPGCDNNPYPCETFVLSILSLVAGFTMLCFAYLIECWRAMWLAKHGVNGGITGEKSKQDFRCLSTLLFLVLLLNLVISIGPWCYVIFLIVKTEKEETGKIGWIPILACVQIVFFGLMAMWEVIIRKVKIFEVYDLEANFELRNQVGMSRSRGNELPILPLTGNADDSDCSDRSDADHISISATPSGNRQWMD